jgi:transposase
MPAFLGIDVAKDTLACALIGPKTPRHTSVPNTPAGQRQLLAWLAKQHIADVHACLEATGTYSDAIAQALHDAGIPVSVVNPARIAAYAKSRLARNKTDQADAVLIAQFAQREPPPRWQPPAPELRALRALVRHLDSLLAQRQAEGNRQAAGGHPEAVSKALDEHLAFLDKQIAAVRQQIDDHIGQHPALKRAHDLLDSITGIDTRTATRLLAETGGLGRFEDSRAVAAYAGLTPRRYQSGSSVRGKTRLSKVGNAALRAALYMPALVARHRNGVLKAFGDRLAAAGKPKMAVIGAVMRKLLVLAYGVVKSGVPFDAAYGKRAQGASSARAASASQGRAGAEKGRSAQREVQKAQRPRAVAVTELAN